MRYNKTDRNLLCLQFLKDSLEIFLVHSFPFKGRRREGTPLSMARRYHGAPMRTCRRPRLEQVLSGLVAVGLNPRLFGGEGAFRFGTLVGD